MTLSFWPCLSFTDKTVFFSTEVYETVEEAVDAVVAEMKKRNKRLESGRIEIMSDYDSDPDICTFCGSMHFFTCKTGEIYLETDAIHLEYALNDAIWRITSKGLLPLST